MRRKDRAVTEPEEIEAILKSCRTCHLAMAEDGQPYVVPLSYGYKWKESGELELYFHSAGEGKKLDILKKNPRVCFEISKEGEIIKAQPPCNSGLLYASIIGNGKAYFVDEVSEKCRALSELFYQQTGSRAEFEEKQADSVCVFKVVSADYTAKRKA